MSPENKADEQAWKCAGCGAPSPNRVRACDCPTECLFQLGVRDAVLKVEPTGTSLRRIILEVLGMRPKRTYSQDELSRVVDAVRAEERARADTITPAMIQAAQDRVQSRGEDMYASIYRAMRAAACLADNQSKEG